MTMARRATKSTMMATRDGDDDNDDEDGDDNDDGDGTTKG
jgi:hypothetical protein